MLRFYNVNNRDITDEYPFSSSERCSDPSCLGEPWCSAWGICEGVALAAPTAHEPVSEGRGQVACNCSSEPQNEETDELTSTTTMLDQLSNLEQTSYSYVCS